MTFARSRNRALLVLATTALLAAPLSGSAAAGQATPSIEREQRESHHASAPASPAAVAADPWAQPRPPRILRDGGAGAAGLLPERVDAVTDAARAGLQPSPQRPRYAGAVVLAARHGVVAVHEAAGDALRYSDDAPTLLPAEQRLAMRHDTIFDLASVSKLFTTLAVMQLVEQGRLDLDAPVAASIPAFAAEGKGSITPRHLLTHTSGLPAWKPLYRLSGTRADRIAAVYATAPTAPPGTVYRYSDLGLIVLGELVAAVSGERLDRYVAEHITGPLGMRDTGYNPDASLRERIAATEYQPWTGRGMVHGSVHDENAWSLDGVAGHAGVFSTARDLAVLAQTLLNGGRYGTVAILQPETVAATMHNENREFPGNEHGLGFELYQHWYMDALATPYTAGHTGYTGTSLVIDPVTDSLLILLTNRVHPSRSWGSNNPDRRAAARALARAVPVDTRGEAWFSGLADGVERTLTTSVDLPAGAKTLRMAVWVDTEPHADRLELSASTDGAATWTPLGGTVSSDPGGVQPTDGSLSGWWQHRWHTAVLDLGSVEGATLLRATYRTDALYSGRGVYVGDASVATERGRLPLRDWEASGWVRQP